MSSALVTGVYGFAGTALRALLRERGRRAELTVPDSLADQLAAITKAESVGSGNAV